MSIVLDGTGTISGLSAGGLPDATVTQAEIASGVAGTGPAFFANGATSASLTAVTNTKVAAFSSEVFDTNSNFDTANSRFTPTVAGYYQISACVRVDTSNSVLHASLYKNGAIYAAGNFRSLTSGTTNNASTISTLIYLDGVTDYVEVYAFVAVSSTTSNAAGQTWFSGVLVRAA